ncbi:hypothetical protein [Tenacibaculum phage Larrie]|nr:hypothetical protein [Tenacibaculum phage Larrie]
MLDTQRGLEYGKNIFTILGRSRLINISNLEEDIWMKGGLYEGRIEQAEFLNIVSDSANDSIS